MMVCAVGRLTPLEPGQRVARRYEVLPPDTGHHPGYTVPPGTGTYRVADSLEFSTENGAPETTLSYEVRFDLAAAD